MSNLVHSIRPARKPSCCLAAFAILSFGALTAAAQQAGNGSLNGAYYMRYLGANTQDGVRKPLSFQGIITFDGAGKCTLADQGGVTMETANHSLSYYTRVNYHLASNGTGWIENPFTDFDYYITFGIAEGGRAIVGSSLGSPLIDLFVAVPVSTGASTAALTGKYHMAGIEFRNGDANLTRDAFFPATFDGRGGLADISIVGKSKNQRNSKLTQISSGAAYSVASNGKGTLTLPAPIGVLPENQLLAGDKTLYVSPDGALFIAGSAAGYDLTVGIKAFSGSSPNNSFGGVYFKGGVGWSDDPEDYAYGFDSYFGAMNEISSLKMEVYDQGRTIEGGIVDDFVSSQSVDLGTDGVMPGSKALGASGTFMIGSGGEGTAYLLSLRVKSPAMTGSGVFLNPQGVVNAASNTPFTTNLAPGEFVSLYGSGLSPVTLGAPSLPLPTTLGGVRVIFNGTPAPIYYVSPTLISAIIPYSVPEQQMIEISVENNGVASNVVEGITGITAPGIFTIPSGGLGNGAALHADYSLVSTANPARAGETVLIFLTGLGAVKPSVTAGAPAPSNPASSVSNWVEVYLDGRAAKVSYAGLVPGVAGLYQLNVTIPAGLTPGNIQIEIDTSDSTNVLATLPVGK